jgi:hypothetical protein
MSVGSKIITCEQECSAMVLRHRAGLAGRARILGQFSDHPQMFGIIKPGKAYTTVMRNSL